MVRCFKRLLPAVLLAGISFSASAQMECKDWLMNMQADDTAVVYVNDKMIQMTNMDPSGDGLWADMRPHLKNGKNTIAVKLTNGQWGGTLGVAMKMGATNFRTDGSWKFTSKKPPQISPKMWYTAEYPDTALWSNADTLNATIASYPGFVGSGTSRSCLYFAEAKLLYGSRTNYFRKKFSASAATANATFKIRGNNFKAKVYLNGTEIGNTNTTFSDCGTSCQEQAATVISGLTLNAGENTLAIEATDVKWDGNGALMKCGIFPPSGSGVTFTPKTPILSDSTWKTYPDLETGWNTAAFVDTAWAPTGKPGAYDPLATEGDGLAGASYVWPTTFYFRKTFDVSGFDPSSVIRKSLLAKSNVAKIEYYNVMGEKVSNLSKISKNSIIVKKNVLSNGSVVVERIRAGR